MSQNQPKPKVLIKNKVISLIMIVAGGFFTFLFFITFISILSTNNPDEFPLLNIAVILLGLSSAILYTGLRRRKMNKLFENYAARLSMDPLHSIDTLASSENKSVNEVKKNLNLMVKMGYFPQGYIDYDRNCLVLPRDNQVNAPSATGNPRLQNPITNSVPTTLNVTCRGCGATNRIASGNAAECEYCGSPISE